MFMAWGGQLGRARRRERRGGRPGLGPLPQTGAACFGDGSWRRPWALLRRAWGCENQPSPRRGSCGCAGPARVYVSIFLLKFHIGGSTFSKLAFLHASLLPTQRGVFLITNCRGKRKIKKKKKKKEKAAAGWRGDASRRDDLCAFTSSGLAFSRGSVQRWVSSRRLWAMAAPGARGAQRRGRARVLRVPGPPRCSRPLPSPLAETPGRDGRWRRRRRAICPRGGRQSRGREAASPALGWAWARARRGPPGALALGGPGAGGRRWSRCSPHGDPHPGAGERLGTAVRDTAMPALTRGRVCPRCPCFGRGSVACPAPGGLGEPHSEGGPGVLGWGWWWPWPRLRSLRGCLGDGGEIGARPRGAAASPSPRRATPWPPRGGLGSGPGGCPGPPWFAARATGRARRRGAGS